MLRVAFLALVLGCCLCVSTTTTWYDVGTGEGAEAVRGRGFALNTTGYNPFVRLPESAEDVVPDAVWDLSLNSAGLHVVFETDATDLYVNYSLTSPDLDMVHMPATGVSGVDLYCVDDTGVLRWAASSANYWGPTEQVTDDGHLLKGATPQQKRTFVLYFPLYNGLNWLHIGASGFSSFTFIPPPVDPLRVVVWGTSIAQGAVACRPGMAYVNMLGRWLGREYYANTPSVLPLVEMIDLGFSGNGMMQPSVVPFIAGVHPADVFVIQCNPNMDPFQIATRTDPMVLALRHTHPTTPILLVEGHTYSNAWILPSVAEQQEKKRKALHASFDSLIKAGVENLYYLKGDMLTCQDNELSGCDDEATVDGTHPSDLGNYRMTQLLSKTILPLMGGEGGREN
eukprot:CAMPEP_0201534954 /NCGR_PEP_ID=MMETSP0161_2-20130828/57574_1 /ASSEMBLY_ACC=CAM_ASM_000251 /TAXON_ID=180227 /ORGANISM="Neoparamoeba aestuarina, Strain SoJaBio B1-5/56/2" /LENGTH=396 /DNA_ID=CAMNT_0047939859 /DNA_START=159 /DNA_END=1349 /DNA_ORIENTATION=-